jgi:hypothetical protein
LEQWLGYLKTFLKYLHHYNLFLKKRFYWVVSIERKKEIGVGIGPLPSGSQNIDLQMEVIRVEEIVNALLTKAKIEVAIPPGTQI